MNKTLLVARDVIGWFDEDKGNPSTANRSHQLALTHLRQRTSPNVSAPKSNHQVSDLRGAISSDDFANHGLALR